MWGLPPQNLSSPLYTTCDLSKTNSVDQNDLKKKKKRFPIILSIELKKKNGGFELTQLIKSLIVISEQMLKLKLSQN